jgi:hypothetical protein
MLTGESTGMALPADFQFHQANLQDYVECQRRFQLRYLRHVAWPAVPGEKVLDNEKQMQLGDQFHHMVHQSFLGISSDDIVLAAKDENLQRWWSNYMQAMHGTLAGTTYPERTLAGRLQGYRLLAKYDFIAVLPGRKVTIYDWKTARRKMDRKRLAARLQTRAYMYLLVEVGAYLNAGQPIRPEQIELIYWFANYPDEPERFCYGEEQYRADHRYLAGLVQEIDAKGDGDFSSCTDDKVCGWCVYRSLCGQGTTLGDADDAGTELEPEGNADIAIDFEQIAEIEF